jgi:hypothetical protein
MARDASTSTKSIEDACVLLARNMSTDKKKGRPANRTTLFP